MKNLLYTDYFVTIVYNFNKVSKNCYPIILFNVGISNSTN